jgi:hypothetical protein
LHMFIHSCITGMKSLWSWHIIFLNMLLKFTLQVFYWEFLLLCSLRKLTYWCIFCCCILFYFWYQSNTGFIEWVW